MEAIANFVLTNWADILLALFSAWVLAVVKKSTEINAKEQELGRKEFKEEMKKEITESIAIEHECSSEQDKQLKADIEVVSNAVENLTKGVLSMQGKDFKAFCEELLEPGHEITIEEYEQVTEDHSAYNGLGGNHRGDDLFKSVMIKWNSQLGK